MHDVKATLKIDNNARYTLYNPMIFGGFLEHFDNQVYGGVFEPGSPLADEDGFRVDVLEAIKELRTPVIRWPGGCFVDAYHWRKGVGPDREPYGDPRWGVIEPNTFGTHEFVEFCRRAGAEPYICFNGLASPRENLNWVSYCNATEGALAELRRTNGASEPFNVKFWSVGNERCGREYIDRVRDTARGMKAFDADLQIMCSGAHGGRHAVVDDYLFESAADYLDLVSIHNYWMDRADKLIRYDYATAISKSELPELYIADTIEALRKAGQLEALKISFDEWNLRAWQHPKFPRNEVEDFNDPMVREVVEQRRRENDLAEQYTLADALFSASFFNACLRHADTITMAAVAPLVNTRGPLFVHPNGIVKRTHFHAMSMYANLLQARVVDIDIASEPLAPGDGPVALIDAMATVDKSGKQWSIALINRHPSEKVNCKVTIKDRSLEGRYKATILAGDSTDAYNDITDPDRVTPVKTDLVFNGGSCRLPAHSLSILEVSSHG